MKTKRFLIAIIFLSTTFLIFSQKQSSISPTNLTTEYLTSPTGLDIQHPRFSWKLTTTNKNAFGQKQTAYRILVSSSKRDKGDVWD